MNEDNIFSSNPSKIDLYAFNSSKHKKLHLIQELYSLTFPPEHPVKQLQNKLFRKTIIRLCCLLNGHSYTLLTDTSNPYETKKEEMCWYCGKIQTT